MSADASGEGYFYPREVAEILGVPEIDYAQLRRLFKLARHQALLPVLEENRAWSRYTLRDVARVRVALGLAGGKAALMRGKRLKIAAVERAVEHLLTAGIADPLLEVRLERQDSKVFALVDGVLIDPANGQGLLREVFDLVARQLGQGEGDVLGRLRQERDRKIRQERRSVQLYHSLA